MTIGRLARRAGVHVETIRYYQRLGLIEVPARPPGGFRRYPESAVQRLVFIRRAQGLGFTLREIGELLDLGEGRCPDVAELARRTRARIRRRIADLEAMCETLDALVAACEEGRDGRCPTIEHLFRDNPRERTGSGSNFCLSETKDILK